MNAFFKISLSSFMKKQLYFEYNVVASSSKTITKVAPKIYLTGDSWTETMAEKSYLLSCDSSFSRCCPILYCNHTASEQLENWNR